jgi:hypothetical protein
LRGRIAAVPSVPSGSFPRCCSIRMVPLELPLPAPTRPWYSDLLSGIRLGHSRPLEVGPMAPSSPSHSSLWGACSDGDLRLTSLFKAASPRSRPRATECNWAARRLTTRWSRALRTGDQSPRPLPLAKMETRMPIDVAVGWGRAGLRSGGSDGRPER